MIGASLHIFIDVSLHKKFPLNLWSILIQTRSPSQRSALRAVY